MSRKTIRGRRLEAQAMRTTKRANGRPIRGSEVGKLVRIPRAPIVPEELRQTTTTPDTAIQAALCVVFGVVLAMAATVAILLA